ncbi:MAG: glycosyltransferase [bacterium]
MKDLTIIVPVHEYNETIEALLIKAIKSVSLQEKIIENPEVMVVYKSGLNINENLVKSEYNNLTFLENKGKTDFSSQINLGVENISTSYFSILEFDDEFSVYFLKNVKIYLESYPKTDVLLPLVVEVDKNNRFNGFNNEISWSKSIMENWELGLLRNDVLQNISRFLISGGVFKKESFTEIGKLKTKFKFNVGYEFLLRATHNDLVVRVMPKIGYMHVLDREGAYLISLANSITQEEVKKWHNIAKKEYVFNEDRDFIL